MLFPGDLIYWPSKWYHQSYVPEQETEDGLSVSLSGMHLDKHFKEANRQRMGMFLNYRGDNKEQTINRHELIETVEKCVHMLN